MKRILCSLLVATLPFGSVLANAPKSKNAKVTLVYQHKLPDVPSKSIKGVLIEYGPGGYSPGHTHPKSAFIYATVLEGDVLSQANDGPMTTYKARQSFSELPGDPPRRRRQCQQDEAGQAKGRQLRRLMPMVRLQRQGCSRCDQDRPKWASAMNTPIAWRDNREERIQCLPR
jgi:quercetin dioxygenase-like cupin family protein